MIIISHSRIMTYKSFQRLNIAPLVIKIRSIRSTVKLWARSADIDNVKYRLNGGKKPSRQERFDRINMATQSKLYHLDNEFDIFNKSVTKVVDLGYVPGNWTQIAKFRLCQVHGVEEEKFHEKCHILGIDVLFGTPSLGVSTIQGNIYSKMAQNNVIQHFKEIAWRKFELDQRRRLETREEFQNSYYVKEQNETLIDQEIEELVLGVSQLTAIDTEKVHKLSTTGEAKEKLELAKKEEILKKLDYKPNLIMSDLSAPFMQQSGFFNNTNTRPYLRFNSKSSLNKPITDPLKSSIDLADAALLLTCKILKFGGTFVLRLPKIDLADPEINLLHSRLNKVFRKVVRWNQNGLTESKTSKVSELFFVCFDKRDDNDFDIQDIF